MTIMRWCLAVAVLVPLAVVGAETPVADRPPATSPAPGPGSSLPPCVTAAVGAMSLEERVGQVLMVGVSVNAPRRLGPLVARYHLGGVFLSGRSSRPAGDLRADIAALQRRAAPPLLVAVDQEGWSVQTLKGPDFPVIPAAERLGGGPRQELRRAVADTAGRLAGIGVTVNLGPVADTVPAGLGEGNP